MKAEGYFTPDPMKSSKCEDRVRCSGVRCCLSKHRSTMCGRRCAQGDRLGFYPDNYCWGRSGLPVLPWHFGELDCMLPHGSYRRMLHIGLPNHFGAAADSSSGFIGGSPYGGKVPTKALNDFNAWQAGMLKPVETGWRQRASVRSTYLPAIHTRDETKMPPPRGGI
jgi:hypothetical protein